MKTGSVSPRRSPDGRSRMQMRVRKVRTPQGNAPCESKGRSSQEGRTESAAENIPPMARKGSGKVEMVG